MTMEDNNDKTKEDFEKMIESIIEEVFKDLDTSEDKEDEEEWIHTNFTI